MPEGHTLHRLARLHQRRFGGAPVAASSPQGRFTSGAALIDGLVLETGARLRPALRDAIITSARLDDTVVLACVVAESSLL